jgi:hypothetical protein
MTTLTDPVLLATPGRARIQPAAPLDRSASKPRQAERAFEIESPNGYARTVVGTVEYLDVEARTAFNAAEARQFQVAVTEMSSAMRPVIGV